MSAVPLPSHHPYFSRPTSFQNVSDRLNRLTHRHLFLRSIVPAIGALDYGFLVPENASLSLLGDLSEIHISIDASDLEDWKTVVTASSYVRTYRDTQKENQTHFQLTFQDGSNLSLQLYSAFRYREKNYLNISKVLDKVLIHRDGIKIADICHTVEFHWISSHEKNRKFSTDFRPLLLGQSPDKQVEAAEYICQKYELEPHRLFHLLTHTPTFRKAIDRRMCINKESRNITMLGFASVFQLFMLSSSS